MAEDATRVACGSMSAAASTALVALLVARNDGVGGVMVTFETRESECGHGMNEEPDEGEGANGRGEADGMCCEGHHVCGDKADMELPVNADARLAGGEILGCCCSAPPSMAPILIAVEGELPNAWRP